MYLILSRIVRERIRSFYERLHAGSEQYTRWNAVSALFEPVPRPHLRPIAQVYREIRTHS